MLYICGLLSQICDQYLVNSLEVIAEVLQLPEDVAGVTLLALGGSLPELAIHIFATVEGNEIGIGTIVGSAIFNMTLGVAVVCFLTPRGQFVRRRAVLRDLIAYLLGLAVVLVFRWNGNINLSEASSMIGLYFLFIAFLFVFRTYFDAEPLEYKGHEGEPVIEEKGKRHSETLLDRESLLGSKSEKDETKESLLGAKSEDGNEPSTVRSDNSGPPREATWKEKTWELLNAFNDFIYTPSGWIFSWTVPDSSKRRNLAPLTFLLSMLYVFAISFGLMSLVQWMGCQIQIEESFSGLVILAFGASLPDLITMGTAAHRGHGAMAMSGLVGSNVFDILMGLGLPWLIYVLMYGGLNIQSLRVLKGVYFCVAAVIALFISLLYTKMELKKIVCVLPVLLYVAYIPVEIVG